MAMSNKRFGVLLAAPDRKYVKKTYGGYFSLFVKMLAEEGETWEMFRAFDRQFPAYEDLDKYDGFVVTGSKSDAHGDALWVVELCQLLRTLHAMRVKVVGICFGHQILCRALGGQSGRSSLGWDIGTTTVTFGPSFFARKCFQGLKIPATLDIIKIHRDKVTEVPEGAEIIASSEKAEIEMFCLGDHILGIQGHPEYSGDIVIDLMNNVLQGLITEKTRTKARKCIEEYRDRPDQEIWQQICKSFLKFKFS